MVHGLWVLCMHITGMYCNGKLEREKKASMGDLKMESLASQAEAGREGGKKRGEEVRYKCLDVLLHLSFLFFF